MVHKAFHKFTTQYKPYIQFTFFLLGILSITGFIEYQLLFFKSEKEYIIDVIEISNKQFSSAKVKYIFLNPNERAKIRLEGVDDKSVDVEWTAYTGSIDIYSELVVNYQAPKKLGDTQINLKLNDKSGENGDKNIDIIVLVDDSNFVQPTLTEKTKTFPSTTKIPGIGTQVVSEITLADGTKAKETSFTTVKIGDGQLNINCPLEMEKGNSYLVSLEISPNETGSTIQQMRKTIKVVPGHSNKLEVSSPVYIENIDIFPVMIADLQSVGFDITSSQNKQQVLKWPSVVSWAWTVSPKNTGHYQLSISIGIPVTVAAGEYNLEGTTILSNIFVPVEVTEKREYASITPALKPTQVSLVSTVVSDPSSISTIIAAILSAIVAIIAAVITYKATIYAAKISKSGELSPALQTTKSIEVISATEKDQKSKRQKKK